ncbi:Tetraspanin [Meloidogyne graminicola]|uniref:Tetraspanin n=1 Tax=Meloidogyne graminicola TaxID=189291 RepID=A0A8S9ZG24_9BILA|nr:Tetraspanin [Meloidogyne graminicola]
MTPSSSELKRNGIINKQKYSIDKIKNNPRIISKERQTAAIHLNVGNLSRDRHLADKRRPKIVRIEKPRQEICAPLKWLCFLINFCIFLVSVACLALGLYLFVNAPRSITELADVLLNPAVLLASVGLCSGVVSLFGMFGALRDNVILLKLFSLCVFFAYLLLVVCTCFLFLLVSGDSSTVISIQSVLLHSIARYHSNKNYADFIDYLQEQFECCGSTTFHDWQFSEQFKCNSSNPYPERCGVPYSCCRKSVVSRAGAGEVQNPLTPAIRSIQCWQNAQKKKEQELDSDIYVLGCLQPLRSLFDSHALHIGMIVLSIIFPVCVTVCLSQCLARQIDYQHFLLRREQRRIARNERREKRYLEQKREFKMVKILKH